MIRELQLPTPAVRELLFQVPVSKGGTGSSSASGAAASLGAVSKSAMGAASGVVQLNSSGKIPQANLPSAAIIGPTLSGPTSIGINSTATWTITNYDPNTTYSASCVYGHISVVGNTVYYASPASLVTETLTIAGKTFTLSVTNPLPTTPVLTVTTTGTTTSANVVATTSVFSELSNGVSVGTHSSTDWQVSYSADFSNIAVSSLTDTANLVTWTSGAVAINTLFYVRARHRDTNSRVSEWSNIVQIQTDTDYIPDTETAKLIASDPISSGLFGYQTAFTPDGARLAIGCSKTSSNIGNSGGVYVYRRNGSYWVFEQKITPPSPATSDFFGIRVSMTSDGTRMALTSFGETTSSLSSAGVCRVYKRDTTTNVWSLEATLTASDKAASDRFGYGVAISGDGTWIFVGARDDDVSPYTDCGSVYVFTRSGTTWTEAQRLYGGSPHSSDLFGAYLATSYDGLVLAATASAGDGAATDSGIVYVFRHNGTQFVQEQILAAPSAVAGDLFGQPSSMSANGSYIAVATNSSNAAAKTYIYFYSSSTWSLQQTISSNEAIAGSVFQVNPCLTDNGARLAVGVRGATQNSIAGGVVYLYDRSGTTWTKVKTLVTSDYAASDNVGFSATLSGAGQYLAISATGKAVNGSSSAGAVYIFNP